MDCSKNDNYELINSFKYFTNCFQISYNFISDTSNYSTPKMTILAFVKRLFEKLGLAKLTLC